MQRHATSTTVCLALPPQVAPVCRGRLVSVLADGGRVAAARGPIDEDWCRELGLPEEFCRRGTTGPTFPFPPGPGPRDRVY
jgi:hypothetical protein